MAFSAPWQWRVRPASANAAEPVTQTLELPTLTADLATQVAESADATQQAAANYELQAERDAAAAKAAKQAKADLAEAKQKAEAKKKAEAARKAAAEARCLPLRRARTTLRLRLRLHRLGRRRARERQRRDRHRLPQGAAGRRLRHGRHGPRRVGLLLPGAGRVQAGRRGPPPGLAGPVDGRHGGLALQRAGRATSCTGVRGSAYHVAVYVGNGQYLDAANPSKGVVIQDLSGYPATGAVRVL